MNKKISSKIIFALPLIILLIGLTAYFFIIPNMCEIEVSIDDWLFEDSKNIIDVMRNFDAALAQNENSSSIRVFWWIWAISFAISLFFSCKQLHMKSEPINMNAILKNREPNFIIQDVRKTLEQINEQKKNKNLDSLIYEVKILEEKLAVESDFGYGNDNIINYENSIAELLLLLKDSISKLECDNLNQNICKLNTYVKSIDSLLRKRIVLKRK